MRNKPFLFLSVFCISATALAYEIILMRIFSMTQWHHFAYMIISIALLGFGASGTAIAFLRPVLQRRFLLVYRLVAGLLPVTIVGSYLLSQQNRFNPFEIVWDTRQYFALLEYYLELLLPFLFAATCIGLIFMRYTQDIGRVYCANLIGSGVGAVGVMAALFWVHPVRVLYAIVGLACCGLVAACFFEQHARSGQSGKIVVGLISLVLVLSGFAMYVDPLDFEGHLHISQYKGLSKARHFPGAKLLTESVSPLGVVQTVSSPVIRYAPGLSLNYTGDVPSQIGLFVDAAEAGAIINAQEVDYLDYLSSALVYHLRPISRALVLGAGGGTDVLSALSHEVETVDAVELNRQIIQLVREQFRDFSDALYARANVRAVVQEARGYMATTPKLYDAIQISLLDSFGASAAGTQALDENYLYTVEALKEYYAHLTSQGVLSITRWVKFPPRDNIKLFATAVEALEELGVAEAARHLVSIRSWATCTLLVSKAPLTEQDVARVRAFCRTRAFDLNYTPGIRKADANQYNQLPSAEYYQAAQQLLFGDPEAFYDAYPYYIVPARDDRPYFFHFFTWESLPALLHTMGKEWIPFIEWGYLVLLATLVQATVISIVLILIPLLVIPRQSRRQRPTGRRGRLTWYGLVLLYFTCLGLGYLWLEIVFIQKFTLFLASPMYAVPVIIASFLVFSGVGSWYWGACLSSPARKLESSHRAVGADAFPVILAVGGLIGLSLGYLLLFPVLFEYGAAWTTLGKMVCTLILIAPLGFCMGFPFPAGLHRLHRQADELLPWAYGINGCASVLSPLLATCIAIPWGFRAVTLLAAGVYALAAGIFAILPERQP
jgi:spermidine synthase